MGVGDVRYTVLQTVNEVQRKLGLTETALSNNKLSIQLIDFINDTCNDLSDFGNWQETLVTANVTCVSGQVDYLVNTSANIKNIGDLYLSIRRGPLLHVTIDEMRVLTRVTAIGTPTQYTIFGTDASSGNPIIRVRPKPAQAEDGSLFSVLYYIRTPLYTTSDSNTIIPFPARVVVLGTLARAILNESGGAPTDRYSVTYKDYLNARKEALNRFKGDTGWDVSFTPSLISRRNR
jgi:hypothetical protein